MFLRSMLFSAQGRISKFTFSKHMIGIQIFMMLLVIPPVVQSVLFQNGKEITGMIENLVFMYAIIFLLIFTILIFLADLNTGIKRFHDRNQPRRYIF